MFEQFRIWRMAKEAGFFSLGYIRWIDDLIKVFKFIKGRHAGYLQDILEIRKVNRARGHQYKLAMKQSRTRLWHSFFARRVVEPTSLCFLPFCVPHLSQSDIQYRISLETKVSLHLCAVQPVTFLADCGIGILRIRSAWPHTCLDRTAPHTWHFS